MKSKTILILGAGNVGEACAAFLAKHQPSRIILHTLTEEQANRAKENVLKLEDFTNISLETSFGNVLTTKALFNNNSTNISDELKRDLLEYIYSPLTDNVILNSSLYALLLKVNPDYIIDSINTSTIIGYANSQYQLPQTILDKKTPNNDMIQNMLTSAIIPSLIRFVQVLHKYLSENQNVAYVKVSTTGLGGMGMNIKYTHGDLSETGLSSGILGKISSAGVMHQLLWSLAHTPGINVKVVVPATLIGWQGVYFGKFRSNGKFCIRNKKVEKIKLNENKNALSRIESESVEDNNYLEIPFVDSGENDAYSLAEMTAITAQGQMEAVTREEVARATIDCLLGSTKYDLLTAMDMASLKGTYAAAVERHDILEKLKTLQIENNTLSIATNNLGPSVSKHLFELFFILDAGDFNLKNIIYRSIDDLHSQIDQSILTNKEITNQILSLGLPILQEGNTLTVGDRLIYPKNIEEDSVNDENIDFWAKIGWVDLRKKQIQYWISLLTIMYKELNNKSNKLVDVEKNMQHLNKLENLGEVLAYLYSLSGGNRRKN